MSEQARTTIDGVPVYCSYTEIMDIERMIENPRNPNKHPEAQIKLLARIIKVQGWRAPITISDRSGFIVKGHGRLAAAKIARQSQVPVDRQHYESEAEEWADMIADNRLGELSQIDNTMLLDLLQEVDTGEIDILLTGYSDDDIQGLINAISGADDTDAGSGDDNIPAKPAAPPITKPGDLWILGGHRILCGDATNPEHVHRVMQGEKAAMVHTDPPYGVSYQSASGKFDILKNDDKTHDELIQKLLLPSFRLMTKITDEAAAFYIWHASSTRREFEFAMDATGLIESQYIIWVKNGIVMGHADYQWAHEPCYYASKAGCTPKFYGDRAQHTVWRATLATTGAIGVLTTLGPGVVILDGKGGTLYLAPKAPKGKKTRHIRLTEGQCINLYNENQENTVWEVARETGTEHPTQKPAELARRAIENSSQPGEIVWDSFMGSGTTLIAAELTGRIGYGLELDPVYCDVIVKRYMSIHGCSDNVYLERDGQRMTYVEAIVGEAGESDA